MSETASADSVRTEQVDPFDLAVDDANERTEHYNLHDLEKSVASQGVIQPPLARPSDAIEKEYSVFSGQRRVLAARAVDGVNEIPVVVFEHYDDVDALVASITENAAPFREEVSPSDRARALQKLWIELGNDPDSTPSPSELGEVLGAPAATVSTWLEPLRTPWGDRLAGSSDEAGGEDEADDTDSDEDDRAVASAEPDPSEASTTSYDSHIDTQPIDKLGERTLQSLRTAVDDEAAAVAAADIAADADLSRRDAEELAKRIDAGATPERAAEAVGVGTTSIDPSLPDAGAPTDPTDDSEADDDYRLTLDVTLTGDAARELTERAEARVATETAVAEELLQEQLGDE